jgi:hypothetical protein
MMIEVQGEQIRVARRASQPIRRLRGPVVAISDYPVTIELMHAGTPPQSRWYYPPRKCSSKRHWRSWKRTTAAQFGTGLVRVVTYIMSHIRLIFTLLIASLLPLNGANYVAKSVSQADVVAAIALADDGDTVQIPAGSANWTSTVVVSDAITIQGAGIGKTIITNTQSNGGASVGDGYLTMGVNVGRPGRVRITGIEFRGNRTSNGITFYGNDYAEFQVDNCKFFEFRGRAVRTEGLLSGLVHSCLFLDNFKMIDTYATSALNTSWQTALTLGTTRCTVIEDNTFTYSSAGWYPVTAAASSSHGLGGRATYRYNTWANNNEGHPFYPIIDAHGNQNPVTGSNPTVEIPGGTGGHRATRQLELYNNTFTSNTSSSIRLTDLRGGTILIYNNSYNGAQMASQFYMREEDGPEDSNYLTKYPGYDQHRIWIYNNLRNGSPIRSAQFAYAADPTFIVTNTNLFFRAPQSGDLIHPYTALPYPHPWRSGSSNTESGATAQGVPLMGSLVFEAEDGFIESPFFISSGTVSQTVQTTTPSSGGRARYRVAIPSTGNYRIDMDVDAPGTDADSIFIDFDQEPTTPTTIFDCPLTSGVETRTVSWRGTESGSLPEFSPKIWNLEAGEHTLYIRGREAGAKLDKIQILPADVSISPPRAPSALRVIDAN